MVRAIRDVSHTSHTMETRHRRSIGGDGDAGGRQIASHGFMPSPVGRVASLCDCVIGLIRGFPYRGPRRLFARVHTELQLGDNF